MNTELKGFYDKVTENVRKWKRKNYKIIIGGDFNSDTNSKKQTKKKSLKIYS